jgi:hypothetical protein
MWSTPFERPTIRHPRRFMTTDVYAPSRPEAQVEPTARYRFWMGHVVAAVAWTSFGIALVILTVVIPRKAELSRVAEPTPFLASLSGKEIIELADRGVRWDHSSSGQANIHYRGALNQVRGFDFRGVAKVKPSEHQAFVRRLGAALESAAATNLSGRTWGSAFSVYSSVDSVLISNHHQYMFDGVSGFVEIWGVGRGESLTVIISVHEF